MEKDYNLTLLCRKILKNGGNDDFQTDYRKYIGIEGGLIYANKKYISVDVDQADFNKNVAECTVLTIIEYMRDESPAFNYLYTDIFGGGSGYERLKITKPNEFDIDVLLTLPEVTRPVLRENNIPGYINLQLENFDDLKFENPELYREMEEFVDDKNYLLTKEMKSTFMQSIFDRVFNNYFRKNGLKIGRYKFKIERVQNVGPAFTLTIVGAGTRLSVDLVPCILLDGKHWPQEAYRNNPYADPSDFFLVPKSPKKDLPHIERYWSLSFQKQEREILFDRQFLKPCLRILKRIRDCLGQKVSSYALKTIFLYALESTNSDLDDEIPELWLAPLSYSVIFMLEVYLMCLKQGFIPYFWNEKRDLLDNVPEPQIRQYTRDIEELLLNVRKHPVPKTILKYLR